MTTFGKFGNQKEFLTNAMQHLGLTRRGLSQRLGVSEKTVNNWMSPVSSMGYRETPLIAIEFINELLHNNTDVRVGELIVQISGPRQSGKNILAKFLQEALLDGGAKSVVIEGDLIDGFPDIDLSQTAVRFVFKTTDWPPFNNGPTINR